MESALSPYCSLWGTIYQNGNRAQETQNVLANRASVDLYLFWLLDIAMSVFEWRNLPDGVDERMLEFLLLRDGFCVFFYDEDLKAGTHEQAAPEGYAVCAAMLSGQWDIYNYPKQRTAYATNGFHVNLNEDNSVIVFNDYLRVPMFQTLQMYASRLGETDRTIDVNVMNQKTPKIIRCDEKQRLTFKNIAMQVDGNVYWIYGDKNIDLKDIDILDISAPYVGNDLQVLKHQYWNEALTYLGIENVNTDKRERLVSGEVDKNQSDVFASRYTRLNARKQAVKEINKLLEKHGWFDNPAHKPVECSYRELNETTEHPDEENGTDEVITETEELSGVEEVQAAKGLWAKIKQWLGVDNE